MDIAQLTALIDLFDKYMIFVYILLVGLLLYIKCRDRVFDYAIAILVAAAVSESLKYIINSPRPEMALIKGFEGAGFPSTHTTIAFTAAFFYLFVCHWLTCTRWCRVGKGKRTWAGVRQKTYHNLLLFFVFAGAWGVGYLRVAVGAHYPVDVIAGIILAFWIALPFKYYDVSARSVV